MIFFKPSTSFPQSHRNLPQNPHKKLHFILPFPSFNTPKNQQKSHKKSSTLQIIISSKQFTNFNCAECENLDSLFSLSIAKKIPINICLLMDLDNRKFGNKFYVNYNFFWIDLGDFHNDDVIEHQFACSTDSLYQYQGKTWQKKNNKRNWSRTIENSSQREAEEHH